MKKETKALVEWIAAQIKIAAKLDNSYLITPGAIITHKSLEEDAERFLNSLPEIEEKLCFGGYIQDYNGTLCCHGDKVMYKNKKYTLQWSQPYNRFFLKADKSVRDVWDFGRHEILKVEDNNE